MNRIGVGMECGLFVLDEEIGRGGMGVVHRAHHQLTGTPAAVKLVTAEYANDPKYRAALRFEVEAMASLEHSGVLTVYDYGVQYADEQPTPWLAMELGTGGSLDDAGPSDWPSLYRVLLQILDALAHSHSRGLIHRDLKPENILVFGEAGARRCKLCDFGIAHAVTPRTETHSAAGRTAGTPAFMAPEQFLGKARNYGPWTDLYALGCVAFALCTGSPPFSGQTIFALAEQVLNAPTPAMVSRFPVPLALRQWVDRLLHKNLRLRYRRAADAAFALMAIGESETGLSQRQRSSPNRADMHWRGGAPGGDKTTAVLGETLGTSTAWSSDTLEAATELMTLVLPPTRDDTVAVLSRMDTLDERSEPPPMPATWSVSAPTIRSAAQVVAGLGLFNLREIPFVGRTTHRDRIWAALRAVHDARSPRVVILRGEAGCGKSRLAEWIAARAHEVGAGSIFKVSHSPRPTQRAGLTGMADAFTRCQGLDRRQTWERLEEIFEVFDFAERAPNVDVEGMLEILRPSTAETDNDGTPRVRFSTAEERYKTLLGFLDRFARIRPAIVWIDDAQWGADALQLTLYALRQQVTKEPLTALFVVTVREDSLPDRPVEQRLVDELVAHRASEVVRVTRLEDHEQADLVRRILPLDPATTEEVVRRSHGQALFAVQLVQDWVARDALEPTDSGFALRRDRVPSLPSNIRELWDARIATLASMSSDPHTLEVATEVAAVLGRELDPAEWREVCRRFGATPSGELATLLVSQGFATRRDGYWEPVHGTLVERLLERARAAGRYAAIHGHCADMLAAKRRSDAHHLERRATHCAEAGRRNEAIVHVTAAGRALTRLGACAEAERVFLHGEKLIGSAAQSAHECELLAHQAWNTLYMGHIEAARATAERVVASAGQGGWPRQEAEALLVIADAHRVAGRGAQGMEVCMQARALLEPLNDTDALARLHRCLGNLYLDVGRQDDAIASFERAERLAEVGGDRALVATCVYRMTEILIARGQYDLARERITETLVPLRAEGHREHLAIVENCLGEINRAEGKYEVARAHYEAARQILVAQGSWEYGTVVTNQAVLAQLMGDTELALAKLDDVVLFADRMGWDTDARYAELLLLPSLIRANRHEQVQRVVSQLPAFVDKTGWADLDMARSADEAARMLIQRGDPGSRILIDLACRLWEILDRSDRAEALRARDSAQ